VIADRRQGRKGYGHIAGHMFLSNGFDVATIATSSTPAGVCPETAAVDTAVQAVRRERDTDAHRASRARRCSPKGCRWRGHAVTVQASDLVSSPSGEGNDRLVRESAGIVATSGSLCAAALEVLAHRLPIICAASPAPVAWQMAELWQMSLEKPLAAWQAWAPLGAWPLTAACLMARKLAQQAPPETLALALAVDGASAMRATLEAMHLQVAANAARLNRQSRSPR
jgi:hypothetical protein